METPARHHHHHETAADTSEHPGEIKEAEFQTGRTHYEIIGARNHYANPYLYIPGFVGSLEGVEKLAEELSDDGREQVIIAGQPKYKSKNPLKQAAVLDLHADAILAIIEAEGLTHEPIDVVCHSLGMMIFEQAAKKAADKGYTCFSRFEGSHSYAINPAGYIPNENLAKMAVRWIGFVADDGKVAKKYDADKVVMKANMKTMRPSKTLREVGTLATRKADFDRYGDMGIKPFVLLDSGDKMYPYRGKLGEIGPTVEKQLGLFNDDGAGNLDGAAAAVEPQYFASKEILEKRVREKLLGWARVKHHKSEADLSDEELRQLDQKTKELTDRYWERERMHLDTNARAGHGDVSYHPKRIASAIKQVRNLQYSQERLSH